MVSASNVSGGLLGSATISEALSSRMMLNIENFSAAVRLKSPTMVVFEKWLVARAQQPPFARSLARASALSSAVPFRQAVVMMALAAMAVCAKLIRCAHDRREALRAALQEGMDTPEAASADSHAMGRLVADSTQAGAEGSQGTGKQQGEAARTEPRTSQSVPAPETAVFESKAAAAV